MTEKMKDCQTRIQLRVPAFLLVGHDLPKVCGGEEVPSQRYIPVDSIVELCSYSIDGILQVEIIKKTSAIHLQGQQAEDALQRFRELTGNQI